MMKLLDETTALDAIRTFLAGADHARLAVAFWGKGAIDRLGLNRPGLSLEILCNLDSGACNPAELRRLLDLPGIELRSHPALHAKIYWTAGGAVLGSSNASANGLVLDLKLAETIQRNFLTVRSRIDDGSKDRINEFAGISLGGAVIGGKLVSKVAVAHFPDSPTYWAATFL